MLGGETGGTLMMNAVTWFELPTRDLERAARFYETVLGCPLLRMDFLGVPHAVFPNDGSPGAVGGSLIFDPLRPPTPGGAVVYLDAHGDLEGCLVRAEKAGGRVVLPRTSIGDMGEIGAIVDTEGNHVGLQAF
jgi:predicted enzyme related to lactoylglutathione lyase